MERDNRTWTLFQSHISDTNQSMEKEQITVVRGWCLNPRLGRPLGSKSTYKSIYIDLPLKALVGSVTLPIEEVPSSSHHIWIGGFLIVGVAAHAAFWSL
ncbi:transmembrane protein, putative [Medicago truncatula]|uniref:Transmembrane protein, putative n=1 Tax=Medicago truncatula TaxID=3880 RepID=G7JR28_MEDTR|nr:transmembrane protein, putative [Medicago truncatula]